MNEILRRASRWLGRGAPPRDAGERERAQELLHRSRDFYRSLLEGFPGLVWRSGPDGGRSYFNRSWLEFTGRPLDALWGERWLEDVHPEDAAACARACRDAHRERRGFAVEYRLRRADGAYRRLAERASPATGIDGAFDGFIGACFDVTDARRAQEDDELARREAMQREFVANVSHELRTPVAAIRGFAETLRLGALKRPKAAAEFVETIERHAERLGRLIEDLLAISVLESGRREARPQAVTLAPFVWDLLAGLSPIASRKRVRVRVAIEPELTLWMDRDQLGEVLQDLCDNAIKFSKRGGEVRIEARAEGDAALVCVRDNGPGIPEEELPTLFERFHRKPRPAPEGAASTGLGLSICKGIAEANGGRIWAESSRRGARLWLRLPRVAAVEPSAPDDGAPAALPVVH